MLWRVCKNDGKAAGRCVVVLWAGLCGPSWHDHDPRSMHAPDVPLIEAKRSGD